VPYFIVKRQTTIIRTYHVTAESESQALQVAAEAAVEGEDVRLIDIDESATADWAVADSEEEDD